MSLEFPICLRLREDEDRALRELVKKEPLLERATIGTGLMLMGLNEVRKSGDAFQGLLQILRRRRQGLPAVGAA